MVLGKSKAIKLNKIDNKKWLKYIYLKNYFTYFSIDYYCIDLHLYNFKNSKVKMCNELENIKGDRMD